MKIIHWIGARWTFDQKAELSRLGISPKGSGFSYVQMDEEKFEFIKDWVLEPSVLHAVAAKFSKREVGEADYVYMHGLRSFGYPQPEGTFDFSVEYGATNRCKSCGIVETPQIKPFRVRSDKIKYKAFGLEWIHDEVFVEKAFYSDHLAKFVGSRQVLIHRTGLRSENLIQLDLPKVSWSFDMSNINYELCEVCNRKKYFPRFMGFLPSVPVENAPVIFQSREHIGTGAQAFRFIIMSQEVRQIFLEHKLAKWYNFTPLRNRTDDRSADESF